MISRSPKIAVCTLRGSIGASSLFPGTLTAESVIDQLQELCAPRPPEILVLCINCTGGAPAQTEMIYRYMTRLKARFKLRTIAFIEDFATSAGFWLAASCDEIYALETSLIGSVGIMTKTFDLSPLLKKVGVDRKLYSTSSAKTDLDLFHPHSDLAIERTKRVNAAIESSFTSALHSSRGDRLILAPDELKSGEIWTGSEAATLGLIDAVASFQTFFEQEYFLSHELVHPKPAKKSLLAKVLGFK